MGAHAHLHAWTHILTISQIRACTRRHMESCINGDIGTRRPGGGLCSVHYFLICLQMTVFGVFLYISLRSQTIQLTYWFVVIQRRLSRVTYSYKRKWFALIRSIQHMITKASNARRGYRSGTVPETYSCVSRLQIYVWTSSQRCADSNCLASKVWSALNPGQAAPLIVLSPCLWFPV